MVPALSSIMVRLKVCSFWTCIVTHSCKSGLVRGFTVAAYVMNYITSCSPLACPHLCSLTIGRLLIVWFNNCVCMILTNLRV